jgi:oligopeptide transport system substrate-binding protein
MSKKRWLVFSLLMAALLMAACTTPVETETEDVSGALTEAEAQIAALEAQLAEAQAAGGGDEAALAELEAQLAEAQAAADAAAAEAAAAEAAQCTYNAYRMGWVMDYADPNNIVNEVFGPTSDFQYTFWQQAYPDLAATFEELVTSALLNPDLAARAATWQEAENILVNDVTAVIPIQHYDRTTLVQTNVDYLFPPFGAPRIADFAFTDGGTVLRTAVGTAVPTLDISQSTDTTSSFMIYQMIDAPYKFTEDGGIAPLAATGFDLSEDGMTFTVHLREDAMWSDGVPVTAQHFVDGIKRLLSPEMANDYAYVMFGIVDAAAYNAGEVDDISGLQVIDDYTFSFTLEEPLSYFDSILAFSTFHPVRLDVIEAYGDDWTLPGNFVSNGAYVLVEHNPGENLVFEKNEFYWDAANVPIERIEVAVIAEPATSLAAFESGELDWLGGASFPSEDTPRLVETDWFVRTPRPGVYYLGLNLTAQHTNNHNFRMALSSAIDKRTIIEAVEESPWLVDAWGVIPPELFAYQGQEVGFGFDVDAAQGYLQAYMDEAGIADPGEIVIELWYNKGGSNQQILEAVEAMWEANLGIDVRTVNVEWATYLDTLEQCNVIGGGGF